jgi:hypothetical protein
MVNTVSAAMRVSLVKLLQRPAPLVQDLQAWRKRQTQAPLV